MASSLLQVRVNPADLRYYLRWTAGSEEWYEILASFKDWFSPSFRKFHPEIKQWSVSGFAGYSLYEWAERIFDCLDWPGQEEFKPEPEEPPPPPKPPPPAKTTPLDMAFLMFHLRPTAPLWVAEAVYRTAVKRHHPDVNGSEKAMRAINNAMDVLRAHYDRLQRQNAAS